LVGRADWLVELIGTDWYRLVGDQSVPIRPIGWTLVMTRRCYPNSSWRMDPFTAEWVISPQRRVTIPNPRMQEGTGVEIPESPFDLRTQRSWSTG